MSTPRVVIASVPWTDTDSPMMAPGVLKSTLHSQNIPSIAIDLNAEVRHYIKTHPKRAGIVQFFLTEQAPIADVDAVHELFDWMAKRLLSYNTEWICLSLLTYISQIANRWLCFHLKQLCPTVKIVVGGPGVFVSLKSLDSYAITLKQQKLIDFYISGDGELALPNLLKGNLDYPGINTTVWKELDNLDALPPPNYDDYNWELYKVKRVSIWGSRGCVRKCTFCDIHEHWSKYQWRSADSIFDEMIAQNQRYGINIFAFTDSLVNGNQKEYKKLIRKLAAYNAELPNEKKIKWSGYFIFRPQNQMSEADWQFTAQSGATILSVGVESFVDHIRHHMKKHFNNQDLDYALKMCQRYKIDVKLLMIVGYVTETEQDHQAQLQWIQNNKHFANSPVEAIHIGSTLSIQPGTELYRLRDQLGIQMTETDVYNTWTTNNSTPEIRQRRWQEMQQALEHNGFNTTYLTDNHVLLEQYFAKKSI